MRPSFKALFLTALLAVMPLSQAWACAGCVDCATWQQQIETEIDNHEQWWENDFWDGEMLPGLQDYTDQIVDTLAIEGRMIGGFMDAQNHLNAQRAIQELSALALKNYTPSESVCQFGTLIKSLGASQARSQTVQLALAERSLARQLGKPGTAGAQSPGGDRLARLNQFTGRFCDVQDNNNGMAQMCGAGGADINHNLDIDFTRTIDSRPTLNVDFAVGGDPTADEQNVIALASNLYGNDVFKRFSSTELAAGVAGPKDNRTIYMNLRADVAKRSAAEHSFNVLVGMKAAGSGASRQYIRQVLTNLGMPAASIDRYMASGAGATGNPSYQAQMDILTKKLYQDPAFYANLMDKPANVQRQYAAMQSFGLMQRRDLFESMIRQEMLLSLILEMEISKYQDNVQNRLNTTLR